MPDASPSASKHIMRPVITEPVPFTEYGDGAPAKRAFLATSGWQAWLQGFLVLVVIFSVGLVGAVVWKGEVSVGSLVLSSRLAQSNIQKTNSPQESIASSSAEPNTSPGVSPTPASALLAPLDLSTVEPRVIISDSENRNYIVDLEGKNKQETQLFAEGGMIGRSRRCAFYVQDGNLFRSLIDGRSPQQVTRYPTGYFDIAQVQTDMLPNLEQRRVLGLIGPGYGLNVLGVDDDCQQAIIEVYSAEMADSDTSPQQLYVAPEKMLKPELLEVASKHFVDFVDGAPIFLDSTQNKLYQYTDQHFVAYSKQAIPFTFNEIGLFIDPTARQLYYEQSWSASDPELTDPATGSHPAEGFSQITQFDLDTGDTQPLSSKKGFADVQGISVSPDFRSVVYAQFTELDQNGAREFQLSVYTPQSGSTQVLSQKAVQWADIWLNNNEFLGVEQRPNADATYTNYLWSCSVVEVACTPFVSNSARLHTATQ